MTSSLDALVWTAFAVRAGVLIIVVVYLYRQTTKVRQKIEARRFGARYPAATMLRGVFSPYASWHTPFDQLDVEALRATRRYLRHVVLLSLLVILVNQRARNYVNARFEESKSLVTPSPSGQELPPRWDGNRRP